MQTSLSLQVGQSDIEILEAAQRRAWNAGHAAKRKGEYPDAKAFFEQAAMFGRSANVYRAALHGDGVTMAFRTMDTLQAKAEELTPTTPTQPPEPTKPKTRRRIKSEAFLSAQARAAGRAARKARAAECATKKGRSQNEK